MDTPGGGGRADLQIARPWASKEHEGVPWQLEADGPVVSSQRHLPQPLHNPHPRSWWRRFFGF